MNPKLLIVEDDSKTAAFLERGLLENNFDVVIRNNGTDGYSTASKNKFDVIVLDIGLPEKNGWEVFVQLRKDKILTPILFLTAHDQINDRVRGLEMGADDYLIKPFAFAELLARIRLILSRNTNRIVTTLKIADLMVDLTEQKVYRNGQKIDLTATEYLLLCVLMRNSPTTVSRKEIIEKVWDMHFDSKTNIVEVTIKRLRSKIDDPFESKIIKNIRGIGYSCHQE